MRVLVLGGTGFVGRAMVAECAAAGHDVIVVHRGITEPDNGPAVSHLHVARKDLIEHRTALAEAMPDVIVDTIALTRSDAEAADAAFPADVPLVVLSSMDVYGAWGALLSGESRFPVPLTEDDPVRTHRYPYRGKEPGLDHYEKLDVEAVYRHRDATICRLPAVYGPHDDQRREEFILRRVRARRRSIPFGSGNWLWSRLHVADAARALRLMVESEAARGETFHVAPRTCLTVRQYAEAILEAAGWDAELVPVPDTLLPEDLRISAAMGQHLLADAAKARTLLGWEAGPTLVRIADSVGWHLAHPPPVLETKDDFSADDEALASVR